jgi:hypothetical protein
VPEKKPILTEPPPNEYLVENFDTFHTWYQFNATQANDSVPPILDNICRRCLAATPNDRFDSAREMADALRSAVGGIVTEADWLACTDPARMLMHLCNLHSSARKLRLFACACVGPDLYSLLEPSKNAVLVAERFADGQATEQELNDAANEAWAAADDSLADPIFAAACCAEKDAPQAALKTAKYVSVTLQCRMLHDLFGPTPFRTPEIGPAWRSWKNGEVVRLASRFYDAKTFTWTESRWDIMEQIADLLEQAGCKDEALLTHCKTTNRHSKGCWVIDLLLGKT